MKLAWLSNFWQITLGFWLTDLAVHGGPTTCSLATKTPPSLLGVCCLSNVMETWPPERRSRVRSSVWTPRPSSFSSFVSWGNITSLSSLLESVGINSLLALPLSPSLLLSPCNQSLQEATNLATDWFGQATTQSFLGCNYLAKNWHECKWTTKVGVAPEW